MNAKKIATSLPSSQYAALERIRHRLKLKRSDAVQEALKLWLAAQDEQQWIEQYVRGYLNHPTDAKEAVALTKAFCRGMEKEDWS